MNFRAELIVQEISRLQLLGELRNLGLDNIETKKKIVWGAGVSGKNFIKNNAYLNFDYIVDTRAQLQSVYMDLPILDPIALKHEDKNNTIIFTPTVISYQVIKKLKAWGFVHIVTPAQVKTGGVKFNVDKKFCQNGFLFDLLDKSMINYTTFREITIDSIRPGQDIDIFMDPSNLEALLDSNLMPDDSNDAIELDISWSSPTGLHNELLLFPKTLADEFLRDKNNYKYNNIRTVNNYFKLIKSIYGILIHKGSTDVSENKKRQFNDLLLKNNLHIDFSLEEIDKFLQATKYYPRIDFINKWRIVNGSTYWEKLIDSENVESNVVFIFRDILSKNMKIFEDVENIISDFTFRKKFFKILNESERKIVVHSFRGGVWLDSYQSKRGGLPWSIGVYRGKHTHTAKLKQVIRERISQEYNEEINCIHSSDSSLEVKEYVDALQIKAGLEW